MDIDLDLNSVSSQQSMSISVGVSDVNLHRIKRLCIREETDGSESSSEAQAEGYASEEPSSVASMYVNSERSNYFQNHGQVCVQTNERLPTSEIAPPFRRRNLKRPHSSLSIDATAGSANTFFSSIYSEDMAVAINDQGFSQRPVVPMTSDGHCNFHKFERLSTVSAEEIERTENALLNNGDRGCDQPIRITHEENIEESDQRYSHQYESFNSVLGSLHLERERRAREMRMRKQSNPHFEMNVNSGSVSSLTSFSTAAGTEIDGKNRRGNHGKIPKQVHLQSHSNLG